MSSHEHINYLAGSPYRPEILAMLCEDDLRPAELTAEIDVTRTTVQRILAGFTERNWLMKRNGAYRATATGRRLYETYETLSQEVARAETYGPLAVNAEEAVDVLAPEIFTQTTATVATNRNPLAPIERYFGIVSDAEKSVRQFAPIVTTEAADIVDRTLADSIPFSMIIDTELFETMQLQFPETLERWNNNSHFAFAVSQSPIEYGLSIIDDIVLVGSIDQGQNLEILVEGTHPDLFDKSTSFYEQRWAESTPGATLLSE